MSIRRILPACRAWSTHVVNDPVVMVSMMRRPIMSSDLLHITFVNFVLWKRRTSETHLRRPVRPLRRYQTMAAEIETSATTATPRPDDPVDCEVSDTVLAWLSPGTKLGHLTLSFASASTRIG